MPGIGSDILDVLKELGKEVNVYKHASSSVISGEFIDTDQDIRATQPFESEHMISCIMTYNTQAVPGDRLDMVNVNARYLVGVLTDQLFEHEIYAKEGVLFKCNQKIQVKRKNGSTRDSNYDLVPNWEEQFSGEYAMFTGTLSDHDIADERYGRFYQSTRRLYVSKDLDVRSDDRCIINGENFHVQKVEPHRLPGVKICSAVEDRRE